MKSDLWRRIDAFGRVVILLVALLLVGATLLGTYVELSPVWEAVRIKAEDERIKAEAEANDRCARREATENRVIEGRTYLRICGQWRQSGS